MLKLVPILLLFMMLFFLPCSEGLANPAKYQSIPVFCYHDVVTPDRKDVLDRDVYAISTKRLEEHFQLYKKMGYTPISMQQYIAYIEGKGTLPKKPVMITFDDGRDSMYYNVYPLLQKYNYPAVFAIILSYMEIMPADIERMVTWDQLNEMAASGLVEVASHSYNLHNYIVGNSYGDRHQNVNTIWWTNDSVYESEKNYQRRIISDMKKGRQLFKENFKYPVSCMVWPFGVYNEFAKKVAADYGYKYQLMLNDDFKQKDEKCLSRFIIYSNPTDAELKGFLEHRYKNKVLKAGQIDIDTIYDRLPEQFERNIDAAADKMSWQGINTVFLQAFSDSDGDGNVDSVYFQTDEMPVKYDVFSHVVVRLKEKGFKVYAWMPLLSYSHMTENSKNVITAFSEDKSGWYKRATPFSPQVHNMAKALVKDLVMYAPIDGILFQDDLYMNDFEDFSFYGKKAFKKNFGVEISEKFLQDIKMQKKWSRLKTRQLNDLTMEVLEVARYYRPELSSARNIYPIVITSPESEVWFAQNYDDFLNLYDHVIVMAYPDMEAVEDDEEWLGDLVCASLKNPAAKDKVVFKLQGYDWRKGQWIKNQVQERRRKTIRRAGGTSFAQYPINIFDE